jgi:DNA mismatch endonuclease (patch repair protein)
MALIRGKNTKPELIVRRLVYSMRCRYRLHDRNLPGRPDLVFKSRRKVIFVHGCFWHRHVEGCTRSTRSITPKSRVEFWDKKLAENVQRDRSNQAALHDRSWDFLIIWECELKDLGGITGRVRNFLG